MKKNKYFLAILLVDAMLLSVLAGCSGTAEPEGVTEPSASATSSESQSAEPSEEPSEEPSVEVPGDEPQPEPAEKAPEPVLEPQGYSVNYPLTEKTVTFDCFASVPSNISNLVDNSLSEFPVYEIAEEATGIYLEWKLTSPENEQTQLNLLVASGDYPTYFKAMDALYTAGKDASVDDGVALEISGMLEEFAPDYYNFAVENNMLKLLTSDAGNITSVAPLATSRVEGSQIRVDWLEELSLEVPTTIDELNDVLMAFKTEKGADNAVIVNSMFMSFAGSYDFSMRGFAGGLEFNYIDGKAVPYFENENFIAYLDTIKYWVENGLCLDYMSISNPGQYEQIVLNDNAGYWISGTNTMADSFYASYLNGTIDVDPIATPTMTAGMELHVGGSEPALNAENAWTVSQTCENPELALGYLNWFYTEEGNIAASFGREGEALVYVNGEPTFTDLVLNNPEVTYMSATQLYVGYGTPVTAHANVTKAQQSTYNEDQLFAEDIWMSGKTTEYAIKGDMTALEAETYAAKSGDIGTLFEEFMAKYINSGATLDDYNAAIETAYQLGLQECIDIKLAAHERYLSR